MNRLLVILFLLCYAYGDSKFRVDDSQLRVAPPLHPNSHIKIFLPSIPYSYIAKSTNAGLIRSYNNEQGWVYDLAKSHKRMDEVTYVFELRKNLKFQDGTPFTINNVIRNLENFKKYPILYTNIDKVGFTVKKLDAYTIKIRLHKKYEMFLNDLARMYFYTDEYLTKHTPKGSETGSANKVPGAFGMGPYILKKGYALGQQQTSQLQLQANPYYWNKAFPKIKKITVFTQLDNQEALLNITKKEGELDFMPLPFNKKLEVLLSKHSKLVVSKSTDNFVIFFNLINGHTKLQNKEVRQALNEAINQDNLLNFVYKKEGTISPFTTSINYKTVHQIAQKKAYETFSFSEQRKKALLQGLSLNIFTQDRFMFLLKGIEYQLKQYGVTFNYMITNSEKDIYKQLFKTKNSKNSQAWDLLVWGDDDWYHQNPWTVFFIYEKDSVWSTIPNDELLDQYIQAFFETKQHTLAYKNIVSKILNRARNQAYTLRVPSPNKVIALNKEVIFQPSKGGVLPLWEMQITTEHWSVRKDKPYNKWLQKPVLPTRIKEITNE